jgi:FlaA1/EpsC-like NDP-sugar epimerase
VDFLFKGNTPRWIIFLIDIGVVVFSFFAAYMLRFDFSIPPSEIPQLKNGALIFILIRAISFFIAKTYSGIIRYTSTEDAVRIALTIASGSILFCVFNLIGFSTNEKYFLPFTIIFIEFLLTVFFMISLRLGVKMIYLEISNPSKNKNNVVIYGAGKSGIITKRTLDRDAGISYKVLAFFDDNKNLNNKKIEGVIIQNTSNLDSFLSENNIHQLIISIQNPDPEKKQKVIATCLKHNVNVLNVPPVDNWINGELSFKQIKNIRIEDLLGRSAISLKKESLIKQIKNKIVLVTGAAGSIGSGLVKEIIELQPHFLYVLDQAESPLFELESELFAKGYKNFEVVIADVRNIERMENVFKSFSPEIVFHAAAYKHVPLMELNPTEAVFTNVLGTKIMVDLSIKYKIDKFVFISTDKAVNPTSVMGATKRVAEIYAQSAKSQSSTKFITTRFGNVLGSNGSVIPLFKKQIEAGGPLTVTHTEVTRYFMTIPEACQLVLEAASIGEGGEIFVFDMGEPVKIIDLAKSMIQLSGLELDKDIKIEITGLRPGEKLYEELLNQKENTLPTHHSKILIAKVREYNFSDVNKSITQLINLFNKQDNDSVILKIKELIPEYKSNNSEFSKFDS